MNKVSFNKKKLLSDADTDEYLIEPLVLALSTKKFKNNETFMDKFPYIWKSGQTIPDNITWIQMRDNWKWGYHRGTIIHEMVSWIYIRPDVAKELGTDSVGGISGLLVNGILNCHYFVVKKKAIAYFKRQSVVVTDEVNISDFPTIAPPNNSTNNECTPVPVVPSAKSSGSSSSSSSSWIDTKKPTRRLIDDEAKVAIKRKRKN